MRHPLLFQLDASVFLGEGTRALGRQPAVDDTPDSLLIQSQRNPLVVLWSLNRLNEADHEQARPAKRGCWRRAPAPRSRLNAGEAPRFGFPADRPGAQS